MQEFFPVNSVTTLTVDSSLRTYPVYIGTHLLPSVGGVINKLLTTATDGENAGAAPSCAIITDPTIGGYYGEAVSKSLGAAGYSPHIITVPAGEGAKDLAHLSSLCEELGRLRFDRQSFLVALGGGVIGDLVGCVAGLYNRGIRYFNFPTTITAQCDSSIGGKTGVNTSAGKNLVGLFYPPVAVVADVSTLLTLPAKIFNEGFAEVIKHAVLKGEDLVTQLEKSVSDLSASDPITRSAILRDIIAASAAVKIAVVNADEFEQAGKRGSRATLNFGHTIGHALERCLGYGGLYHGEAVAIGMIAAGWISCQIAGLPAECFTRLRKLIADFSLPTFLAHEVSLAAILQAMMTDKKSLHGLPRFVLLRRFGDAFLSAPGAVSDDLVRGALAFVRSSQDPRSIMPL